MTRPWTIMKSNGGAMLAEAAAEAPDPDRDVGPGRRHDRDASASPAALGEPDVLTLDMGGTSADVGIIVGGEQRHTTEYEIEWGLPAAVPLIDIKSIGAGGGSIAWVDAGGFLRVGPRSAGAEPGPICYGRGGSEVTVTDANLLLGRLNPEYFLGGRMRLDPRPPDRAASIGSRRAVGMDADRAGRVDRRDREREHGQRDQDGLPRARPRSAPLRAARLRRRRRRCTPPRVARTLGIPKVIVPPHPGVFSALGLLLADIRVDKVWTQAFRSTQVDAALVERQFERIAERGGRRAAPGGLHRRARACAARSTCATSGRTTSTRWRCRTAPSTTSCSSRRFRRFERLHEERYGYAIEGEVIELLSFKVTAIGAPPPDRARGSERRRRRGRGPSGRSTSAATGSSRRLVLHRSALEAGETLEGPCVIEEEGSTTLVEPGMHGRAVAARARSSITTEAGA